MVHAGLRAPARAELDVLRVVALLVKDRRGDGEDAQAHRDPAAGFVRAVRPLEGREEAVLLGPSLSNAPFLLSTSVFFRFCISH